MRVTVIASNVYTEFGISAPIGSIITVGDDYGISLVRSLKAIDTDGVLSEPGNRPFDQVPPQSPVSGGGSVIGGTFGILGDSMTENNVTLTGTTPGWNDYGWITWARAKAGARGRFVLNAGVVGDTCAQIYARVGAIIAAAPAVCFVLGGKNDATAADAKTYLALIYSALRSAGIKVMAVTIPPHQTGHPSVSVSRGQVENDINDWIRAKCRAESGLYLVDMDEDTVNPTANPKVVKANYLRTDNLHFAALGARAAGEGSVYRAFVDNLPPNDRLVCSVTDTYVVSSASNQVLTNPLLATSGGTTTPGSGAISGTVAANWNVQVAAGTPSVVASLPARSDGYGNDQQIVCTFAGSTDSVRINSPFFESRIAVGDTLQGTCVLSMSGASNVSGIEVFINCDPGGVSTFVKALARTSTTFSQADFVDYVFETPEYLLSAPVTYAQFVVRVWSTAAGAVTLKVGRASVRKIVTP